MPTDHEMAPGSGEPSRSGSSASPAGRWIRAIAETLWQDVCKEAFVIILCVVLFIIPLGAIVAAVSGVSLIASWLFGWEFETTLASILLFGFLAAAAGVLGFEFWERVKQRATTNTETDDA